MKINFGLDAGIGAPPSSPQITRILALLGLTNAANAVPAPIHRTAAQGAPNAMKLSISGGPFTDGSGAVVFPAELALHSTDYYGHDAYTEDGTANFTGPAAFWSDNLGGFVLQISDTIQWTDGDALADIADVVNWLPTNTETGLPVTAVNAGLVPDADGQECVVGGPGNSNRVVFKAYAGAWRHFGPAGVIPNPNIPGTFLQLTVDSSYALVPNSYPLA